MQISRLISKITNTSKDYPSKTFSETGRIYTCVNPYSYHIVRNNFDLYDRMDGIFVDGMTMCWWIRLLWGRKIPRLSFDMTAMAADLFEELNESKRTIYFVGARQAQLEATLHRIKNVYPNLHVVGFRNGYFSNNEQRQTEIDKIVHISPDFVVVGMGSPRQECFVADLKNAGFKGVAFTCGGFLHQTCESINYYPNWVNKYNLRAFYRLYKERGMWSRLFNILIEFPCHFIQDTLQSRLFVREKKKEI
jgi:N-acetylglucosaminyldiphosphoundecaprenol N-acetyl-beta-D-mannosaminyltransferase